MSDNECNTLFVFTAYFPIQNYSQAAFQSGETKVPKYAEGRGVCQWKGWNSNSDIFMPKDILTRKSFFY